ncbi:MAG: hypothetical protein JWN70_5287 [Planctomycetaceae bacterium]|nr:hypothetical protein [Planctomycetaceae bacterium]
MVRITFLIETLSVVLGLPWCVSCALLWAGCQERELSARDRAVHDALEICVQKKLASQQQSEQQTKREPMPQF